jgi:hypothetical protein
LAKHKFEALKECVARKRESFTRVSCINATLPLSQMSKFADDLYSECKVKKLKVDSSLPSDSVCRRFLPFSPCLFISLASYVLGRLMVYWDEDFIVVCGACQ